LLEQQRPQGVARRLHPRPRLLVAQGPVQRHRLAGERLRRCMASRAKLTWAVRAPPGVQNDLSVAKRQQMRRVAH
jgi:hypothetical protein